MRMVVTSTGRTTCATCPTTCPTGALGGPEADRDRDQRHGARRQVERRRPLLHPEQADQRPVVRGGGAWPLGDRESVALATGRDVRRGPLPDQERTRRRQLQHPPPHGPEPVEEREDREGRCEEQTAHRRLE